MADLKNLFTPLNQINANSVEVLKSSAAKTREKSIKMKEDSIAFKSTVDASQQLDQSKTDGILNTAVVQKMALLNQKEVNTAMQDQIDLLSNNQEYSRNADQQNQKYAIDATQRASDQFSAIQADHDSNTLGYQDNLQKAGETSNLIPTTEGLEG